MTHRRQKHALGFAGIDGRRRMLLRLLYRKHQLLVQGIGLQLGSGQLRDGLAVSLVSSFSCVAQPRDNRSADNGQQANREQRQQCRAAQTGLARGETRQPHVDADDADKVTLRIIKRRIRAHVGAELFLNGLVRHRHDVSRQSLHQLRIVAFVALHDRVGRQIVSRDSVQVVGA